MCYNIAIGFNLKKDVSILEQIEETRRQVKRSERALIWLAVAFAILLIVPGAAGFQVAPCPPVIAILISLWVYENFNLVNLSCASKSA